MGVGGQDGAGRRPWEDKVVAMRAEAGEAAAELSRGVPGSHVKGDRHKRPPGALDFKELDVHRAWGHPISIPCLQGAQLPHQL